MLQLLFHTIIVSSICIIWGIPVFLVIQNSTLEELKKYWIRGKTGLFCFLFFAGIISLSFTTSIACLLLPLRFEYLIFTTIAILLFLVYKRKNKSKTFYLFSVPYKRNIIENLFISICLFLFLLLGSLKIVNGDTNIYHIQIIKWFHEYGAVPGIANLFPRYGLGSNWFNLISIFKMPIFNSQNYTWLNTTTVFWFFLWLMNNWKFHHQKASHTIIHKIFSHLYICIILFCLFEWELFRDAANSTNYDFIVTAFTVILILYLLEMTTRPEKNKSFSFIFIVATISLIPFKLSGGFALLLVLFYLLQFKKIKYWLFTVSIFMLIMLPLLIKNYIITGYPIFPLPFSFSSPDWQVPQLMTDYLRHYITVTNRFYNHQIDFSQIPELIHKKWTSLWFSGILIQQKAILLGAFSSLFIFFFKPPISVQLKKLRWLFFAMIFMAGCWFYFAPSPRFGYGVLLILAFFPACLYFGKYVPAKIHSLIIVIAIAATGIYLFQKSKPIQQHPEHLLYPFKADSPPVKNIYINGIEIHLPSIINGGWMREPYDAALPCILQENPYLKARGKRLQDGFKMEPKPDSVFVRQYIY